MGDFGVMNLERNSWVANTVGKTPANLQKMKFNQRLGLKT
jgi:hypothetical protein